ncbi:MAG: ABC transporter permease [Bacilli bacterium]|nr:ABC transporter permease [Bacilli bacterium]
MKKNNVMITLKKELRTVFRDKKTILMIFAYPFIIVFFVVLFGMMEDIMMGGEDTKYNMGINYELDSTQKSIISDLDLVPYHYDTIDKMKEAYDSGEIETYVYYDEEKDLYTIYSNEDIMESMSANYVAQYLDTYNKYLGDMYIKGEDIDPEVAYGSIKFEIKTTEGDELDEDAFLSGMVVDMATTYIIISIAMAAVSMATSAIAAEKENGTLETIITLPISKTELLMGKFLSTAIIGFIASIIGLIVTFTSIGLGSMVFDGYKAVSITFGIVSLEVIICFIASLLIAALAIFLTSSAKSFKEAQSSAQLLNMLPLLPFLFSMLKVEITKVFYMVPIVGHTSLLMDLCEGNINILYILICIVSSIIYVVILLYVVIKKFKSEKVLFGA